MVFKICVDKGLC